MLGSYGRAVTDELWRPYDRMAAEFLAHAEDGAYNAHYDRPAVLELLGDVAGLRVLGAGCGPGLYAEELLARGAAEMRDLDALEATWMQLLRASRRTERIMVEWLADLGMDLLQRDYNRQREVAWALHAALEALSRVNMDLGMVLVRES